MESKNNNLKCAFCRGKGIHPNSERLSCVVCQGRGKVEISQPYAKCEECRGSGRKLGTNLYCLSCRGKSFVNEKAFLKSTKPTNNCQDWKKELKEKENSTKKENNNTKRKPDKLKKPENSKNKTKEIKERLKPVKPFIKEVSTRGGSPATGGRGAFGGKKETLWFKNLGNKIKKRWKSLWEQ